MFRFGGRTEFEGEQTRRTNRIDGNLSASRVTPTWKMNFRANVNFNRREIDLADDSTFRGPENRLGVQRTDRIFAVRGIGPSECRGRFARSSATTRASGSRSRRAIEYSFFPYAEATRRAFTVFLPDRARPPGVHRENRLREVAGNALGTGARSRVLPAPAMGRRLHPPGGVAFHPRHEPVQTSRWRGTWTSASPAASASAARRTFPG